MIDTGRALAPTFIANPTAGGTSATRNIHRIRTVLRHLAVDGEIVISQHAGHAEKLATNAARSGVERVVAVGGDGTVQEVANGLLAHPDPPPMGVVPVGRGNDFARSIGLPMQLEEAVRLACTGLASHHDVGRAAGRHFLNAAGAGFDGEVAAAVYRARHRWQRTKLVYLATTLLELRRYRNRDLVIEIDGTTLDRRALLVAIANGPYYGGGMMICPQASTTDGMLDVCIIGDISRREALKELPGIYRGRHVSHPAVEFHRARRVRVDGEPGTRVHLDGESVEQFPLDVEIVPRALEVVSVGGS